MKPWILKERLVTPSTADPALELIQLSVEFVESDGSLEVLSELNFEIAKNSFVCLIGPSGGGKSTLLRAISGLIPVSQGKIILSGEPVQVINQKPKYKTRVGMVFQKPNLMPWRTLWQNISLPLEIAKLSPEEIASRVYDLVELMGLQGFEKSYPHELSGGMAQRVAIARALAQDPDLLLLDEPFAQLDALNRERMGEELMRVWEEKQKTVLMVTHAIDEAVFLSDRVLVFSKRPAQLMLDLPISLERPRDNSVRYSPKFVALTQELHAALS
jgi:NitT/TauT family transport system ATP-binding protein